MEIRIMVTDLIFRFRLAAIEQLPQRPQIWQLQVMTIEHVGHILVSLGFLDPEAADRLTEASTTITPQPGFTTAPLADFIPPAELVYPKDEPPSIEAQQTYVLIARGETTEEALAAAGITLTVDGPMQ